MRQENRAKHRPAAGGCGVFALFLSLLLLAGCREPGAPQEPGSPTVTPLVFTPGSRFVYDGWTLDRYGNRIDSTQTVHTWNVVSIAGQWAGFHDVTVIVDSVATLRAPSNRCDTLYFRMTTEGEVYQYGFLASLMLRRTGEAIPAGWDHLVSLGAGISGWWRVGMMDSAGSVPVNGMMGSGQDYFQVRTNGTQSAFPAFRIEMTGSALEFFLWASPVPSSFPRLEEGPAPLDNVRTGSLLVLREMVTQ